MGKVRSHGPEISRPRSVLGRGQPVGGQKGARSDGTPGQRVWRESLQILQCALRLWRTIPLAYGRSASSLSVFEKALELGIHTIGVHKGVPLGPQPIEHTQAWDMDGAAANFPDINFVIFHVGLPFIDEICWQLVRYPNLYASIAATLNFVVRAPRVFAENMGKLMFWCGEDKILYGGETPIWHPRWALDAFWKFELPEDLVTGYGYPQLTTQAKKKILGGNLARLMGIDVEKKVAELRK